MSTAHSFTLFSALPVELRLQIWSEALSSRSVWAVVRNVDNDPSVNMAYIGPVPYLAGLSNAEARQVLEENYVKPIRGPDSRLFWVDMDQTIIYLGADSDAQALLDTFHPDDLSRFKHVAISWSQLYWISQTCKRLASACPALCNLTIIIRKAKSDAEVLESRAFSRLLGHMTAPYGPTMPRHTKPELDYENPNSSYFRSLLLDDFHISRPRLHIFPPGSDGF